jgi:serine/threonine protein kinase
MPPESFNGTRENSLISSQAHDMWSLAVVIFQLANGIIAFPFNVFTPDGTGLLSSEEQIVHIIQAPEYQSNYGSDDGRTNLFINNILINDWHKRPTANIARNILDEIILTVVWACQ